MSFLREEAAAFLTALQFMTRLQPLFVPAGMALYTPERFLLGRAHYPLVGILVGGMCGAVYWLAGQMLAPHLAALLAVAAGVLVTGALHEDGFADVCDGLGGGRDVEHALAIMKDSRVGVFGVVGLGLLLAAKILALAEIPPAMVLWVLIAAHCASRAMMLLVIVAQPYLRTEGVGRAAAGRIPGPRMVYAFAVATLVLAVPPLHLGWAGADRVVLCAAAGLWLGLAAIWLFVQRKLKGYTGDCLGAVQQSSELGLYLGVAASF